MKIEGSTGNLIPFLPAKNDEWEKASIFSGIFQGICELNTNDVNDCEQADSYLLQEIKLLENQLSLLIENLKVSKNDEVVGEEHLEDIAILDSLKNMLEEVETKGFLELEVKAIAGNIELMDIEEQKIAFKELFSILDKGQAWENESELVMKANNKQPKLFSDQNILNAKSNNVIKEKPLMNNLANQMFYGRGVQKSQYVKVVEGLEITHDINELPIRTKHNSIQQSDTALSYSSISDTLQALTPNSLSNLSIEQIDSAKLNTESIISATKEMFEKNLVVLQQGETISSKIKLYPKELGEINVQLELIRGQLNVKIISSSEAAHSHLSDNGKELQDSFLKESFSSVNIEFSMNENFNQDSSNQNFGNQYATKRKPEVNVEEDETTYPEYQLSTNSSYNYKI